MGMSSPEWSRYMHDELGLAESPDGDQRRGRPADARALPRRAAADRRRGRGRASGWPRAFTLGGRLVVEPAADRRRPRGAGIAELLRGGRLLRGGCAREAGAGRLPRGRAAARPRAGAVRRRRGLVERPARRACCRDARDRVPERRTTRRRPTRSRSQTSSSTSLEELTPELVRRGLSSTQPLWPPRPIAFESATSSSTSRASFGT